MIIEKHFSKRVIPNESIARRVLADRPGRVQFPEDCELIAASLYLTAAGRRCGAQKWLVKARWRNTHIDCR